MDDEHRVQVLQRQYKRFDKIAQKHGIFRITAITDGSYVGVTNLAENQPNHTAHIADFASEIISKANKTLLDPSDLRRGCADVTVGMHAGSVVATVIGSENPQYCVLGDGVKRAREMEQSSQPNRIHCSARAVRLLKKQSPGVSVMKDKVRSDSYWVHEGGQSGNYAASRELAFDLIGNGGTM